MYKIVNQLSRKMDQLNQELAHAEKQGEILEIQLNEERKKIGRWE